MSLGSRSVLVRTGHGAPPSLGFNHGIPAHCQWKANWRLWWYRRDPVPVPTAQSYKLFFYLGFMGEVRVKIRMRGENKEWYNLSMLTLGKFYLVLRLRSLQFCLSHFCFEGGIFTPEIGSENGKLIALECRFTPKVVYFGTMVHPVPSTYRASVKRIQNNTTYYHSEESACEHSRIQTGANWVMVPPKRWNHDIAPSKERKILTLSIALHEKNCLLRTVWPLPKRYLAIPGSFAPPKHSARSALACE